MRIVDSAAKVFRHKGFGGTKLSEIAKVAKVQTGSLYYYFDSRDAIVEEVLLLGTKRVLDAMEKAIGDCPADATWRTKIHAAAEAHMTMSLQYDDYTAATMRIFAQVPPHVRSRHRVYQVQHGQIWRDLLQSAQEAGEIRRDIDLTIARLLFIGSMNWAIEWYKPSRGNAREIAAQLVETFFDGVKEPERGPRKARLAKARPSAAAV